MTGLIHKRTSLLQMTLLSSTNGKLWLQQHHRRGLGSLGTRVKVLGSRLLMAPRILGQIHAAQSENIWRESVKMASNDVGQIKVVAE